MTEETEYPFRETIRFTVALRPVPSAFSAPAAHSRLGARRPTVQIGHEMVEKHHANRRVSPPSSGHGRGATRSRSPCPCTPGPGTALLGARFPCLRGPLVYGLRMGERFEQIRRRSPRRCDLRRISLPTPWNYGLADQRAVTRAAGLHGARTAASVPRSVRARTRACCRAPTQARRLPDLGHGAELGGFPASHRPFGPTRPSKPSSWSLTAAPTSASANSRL